MRQHRLYKAVWHWSEEHNRLSVIGADDKEKKQLGAVSQPSSGNKLEPTNQKATAFYFVDTIDQNQQMIFRQKYQRAAKPYIPNVVTMQDIKDVVMFSVKGSLPAGFTKFFCSHDINFLFRIVILYIQLYLKVWEDLKYRETSYKNQHLKHHISIERETLCKKNLMKLRSRIGQEYALIIAGEEKYKQYHHMNNTLNRSYTGQDMLFYDCFSAFITKTVWVALSRSNYKEIESEISRLFSLKAVNAEKDELDRMDEQQACDRNILYGDKTQYSSKWHNRSPVISDIFKTGEIPDILVPNESFNFEQEKTRLTGLEAALKLPEEVLVKLNLTVGILGQPRDSFEPLLTVKQKQENIQLEELEKVFAVSAEEVKPKDKMYTYLHELDADIDLNSLKNPEETINIMDEIKLYRKSHLEDSKRSFLLWKKRKGSCWSLFNNV